MTLELPTWSGLTPEHRPFPIFNVSSNGTATIPFLHGLRELPLTIRLRQMLDKERTSTGWGLRPVLAMEDTGALKQNPLDLDPSCPGCFVAHRVRLEAISKASSARIVVYVPVLSDTNNLLALKRAILELLLTVPRQSLSCFMRAPDPPLFSTVVSRLRCFFDPGEFSGLPYSFFGESLVSSPHSVTSRDTQKRHRTPSKTPSCSAEARSRTTATIPSPYNCSMIA